MKRLRYPLVAIMGAMAPAAMAADLYSPYPSRDDAQPASSGWTVTVKGKVAFSPSWNGSDKYSFSGFPSLSWRRAGTPETWSSPDDGIGFALTETPLVSAGPVVRYRAGRYSGSDGLLTGIHDTRWTLEPGLFVNVWAIPETLRARIEIRRGFRSENGFAADFGLDWVSRLGVFTTAIGPRLTVSDARNMRDLYGVSYQDAAWNPTVTPYKPRGGVQSVGLYASATYKISEAWSVTAHGGYDRLVGEAGKSPIVRNIGSRDQWTIGAIVAYSFNFAGF